MYQEKASVGNIIALCGGILAAISFLLFPYISLGLFGSYTAVQLANGIFGSVTSALWLEFLAACAIIALAAYALFNRSIPSFPPRLIIFLSSITLIVMLCVYIAGLSQKSIFGTASSFYATGFWLYIIGIVASLTGAIVQVRG